MPLFTKRKRRATRRAEAKALKHKAALEAKLGAKNESRRDKRAARVHAKAEKAAAKQQARTDKKLVKSQEKVEKQQVATLKAQEKAAAERGITAAKVRRYVTVARLVAPMAAPLVYQAVTAVRAQLDHRKARTLGVPVADLGDYTGYGARLRARVAGAEKSVAQIVDRAPKDAETARFAESIRSRLDDLSTAIDAVEKMPAQRRRSATASISTELDGIEADLLARLGVH